MSDSPRVLPAWASFFLTKHIPCAALALALLSSLVWLPSLLMGVPLLAVLMSFVAILLHLMTPALFALIQVGGGWRYAMQVAAMVAVIVAWITDLQIGLLVGLLYALLPIWASRSLMLVGGVSRSAGQLLMGLFMAVMGGLLLAAQTQGLSLHAVVDQLLAPLFSGMTQDAASLPPEALANVRNMLSWSLPGLLAFGFWAIWWMNVLYARKFAVKYGFYTGDMSSPLTLSLSKPLAYLLMLALLLANVDTGGLQYAAISLALVLAGAFSVQGVAVVHVWLKSRDMPMAIVMMYVLLFLWSMMVIPFIILGLLDIWYDYRRSAYPTLGGK